MLYAFASMFQGVVKLLYYTAKFVHTHTCRKVQRKNEHTVFWFHDGRSVDDPITVENPHRRARQK